MLSAILLWFLLMMLLVIALVGTAAVVFSVQLNRANRVAPDVETLAPLLWLWSPTQQAKMHRRLRGAVAPVHASLPKEPRSKRARRAPASPNALPSPTAELGRTLVDQAVTLDRHVVMASRLPRPQRRTELRGMRVQVGEVERLSSRIMQQQRRAATPASTPQAAAPTPPAVLADLSHQLDLLDEAHDELAAIEQANGLLDPDALMRQVAPPAPAQLPPSGPPKGPPVTSTAPPARVPGAGRDPRSTA